MGKFELSIGSFSVKIGADSAINKSALTAVPITQASERYIDYLDLTDRIFGVDSNSDIIKAIKDCPQVGAILGNKCNAYINGKIQVLNPDEKKDTPAKGENGRKWQRLVNQPNIIQSGKSFWANVKFNIMAFGYCPVLRVMADGIATEQGVEGLWVLPPQYTVIKFKKGIPYYETDFYDLIESVKIKNRINSNEWTAPKEDVFIFRDSTPLSNDSYLPSSRIANLKLPINNLVKGYKTEGRIISKPLGAFSRKDGSLTASPIKEEDKVAVSKIMGAKYGTEDDQIDTMILNAGLDWHNIMYPIGQLQIFEGRSANTAIICDGMGYPFDLMGKDKGATYSNGSIADKVLYQNHIIPEAQQIDQQIAECLFAEANNVRYETTFEHIAVLQANQKEKAEVTNTNTRTAQLAFNSYAITYGEFQDRCESKERRKEWEKLYKWEIPELNKKQNGNTDPSGNQANPSGQGQGN